MKIESIKIHNFKGIKKFSADLAPITVFVGRNNTGKSSVIEAIALSVTGGYGWVDFLGENIIRQIIESKEDISYLIHLGAESAVISANFDGEIANMTIYPELSHLLIEDIRYIKEELYNAWRKEYEYRVYVRARRLEEEEEKIEEILQLEYSKFWEKIYKKSIAIKYEWMNKELRSYAIIIPRRVYVLGIKPGYCNIALIRSSIDLNFSTIYKDLVRKGLIRRIIEFIKSKIGYIEDVRVIDNEIYVFLSNYPKPLPLSYMGDGFKALLSLLGIIGSVKNGIIFMEEPEQRLHPGYMRLISEAMITSAKKNEAQFIISTHSAEFLEFLLENGKELISIVKMSLTSSGIIDYIILSGEEAYEEIEEIRMDLRWA